jgi:hypothetical protein
MACWSSSFLNLLPFLNVNKSCADAWLGYMEWEWLAGQALF